MPVAHVLLALLVTLIWGLNFVVIKVGLGDFPPLLFCALRFALAALPLLVLRGPMPAPFGCILLIGVLLGVVKFGLLFVGMAQGMPVRAVVAGAAEPGILHHPHRRPVAGRASRRRAGCSASCWRRRGWS